MKRSEVVSIVNNLVGSQGHQKVLEVYNKQNPLPRGYKLQAKDSWCAATVTAVFLMAGKCDFAECSCVMMIHKAKNLGIWVEDDAYMPKPGDVIMYDWQDAILGNDQGTPDHTGIVIGCDGENITVREGNKSNNMGNRTVKVNGKYIRGFITPVFEEEDEDMGMPQIQKGDKGKAVAIWQLIADAHPDGIFEDNTLEATKIFQKNHGLTVDGIVGPKTWAEGFKSI